MRHILGPQLPKFSSKESNQLKHGLDFIGVNHYSTFYAKDCIHSQCDSGGHAIKGFVDIAYEKDGVPIGEPVSKASLAGNAAMINKFLEVIALDQFFMISCLHCRHHNIISIVMILVASLFL